MGVPTAGYRQQARKPGEWVTWTQIEPKAQTWQWLYSPRRGRACFLGIQASLGWRMAADKRVVQENSRRRQGSNFGLRRVWAAMGSEGAGAGAPV